MGLWRWTKRAASKVGNAIGTAANAVVDAGAAVVDTVQEKGVIGAAVAGVQAVEEARQDAVNWLGEKGGQAIHYVSENRGEIWNSVKQFGKDMVTMPPHRFLALQGQGLLRAGSSTVGMIGDLGRWAARAAVNLGNEAIEIPLTSKDADGNVIFVRDNEGKVITQKLHLVTDDDGNIIDKSGNIINRNRNYFSEDGAPQGGEGRHLVALDENGNFIAIDSDGNIDNSVEINTGWVPPAQEDGMRRYKGIANSWADAVTWMKPRNNAERAILYGTQAVGEIAVFVGVSVVTAGAGGAAIAAARGGGLVARVGGVVAKGTSLANRAKQASAIARGASVLAKPVTVPARLLAKPFGAAVRNIPKDTSITQGFRIGARGATRFMSPIQSSSRVSTELTEKSARVAAKANRTAQTYMQRTGRETVEASARRFGVGRQTTVSIANTGAASTRGPLGRLLGMAKNFDRPYRSARLRAKAVRIRARAMRIGGRGDRRALFIGPKGTVLTRGQAMIEGAGGAAVFGMETFTDIMEERLRRTTIDGYIALLEENDIAAQPEEFQELLQRAIKPNADTQALLESVKDTPAHQALSDFLARQETRKNMRQELVDNLYIIDRGDTERVVDIKLKDYFQSEYGIDIDEERGKAETRELSAAEDDRTLEEINADRENNIQQLTREELIGMLAAFLKDEHQIDLPAQEIMENGAIQSAGDLYNHLQSQYNIKLDDYNISLQAIIEIEQEIRNDVEQDLNDRENERTRALEDGETGDGSAGSGDSRTPAMSTAFDDNRGHTAPAQPIVAAYIDDADDDHALDAQAGVLGSSFSSNANPHGIPMPTQFTFNNGTAATAPVMAQMQRGDNKPRDFTAERTAMLLEAMAGSTPSTPPKVNA